MKILFLLAPSEGKNIWWEHLKEKLNFNFEKPKYISENATQKDLKCSWNRYEEWIELNKNFEKWPFLEAINRYSWVVFNTIDYIWMSDNWKKFFENSTLILSWMYGLLKPLDLIWNYKLPIETKWLYKFWWNKITNILNEINPEYIINLLPNSYLKMINPKNINSTIININFLKPDWKKMSHQVKKYRGEFLKYACENNLTNYEQFGWKIVKNWKVIDVNILI